MLVDADSDFQLQQLPAMHNKKFGTPADYKVLEESDAGQKIILALDIALVAKNAETIQFTKRTVFTIGLIEDFLIALTSARYLFGHSIILGVRYGFCSIYKQPQTTSRFQMIPANFFF